MRTIYSQTSQTVIATCGHIATVSIPPSGGRPGPVGQRRIAEAQGRECYPCRGKVECPTNCTTERYNIGNRNNQYHCEDCRREYLEPAP